MIDTLIEMLDTLKNLSKEDITKIMRKQYFGNIFMNESLCFEKLLEISFQLVNSNK